MTTSAGPGSGRTGLRNDQLSGVLLIAFGAFLAWQNRAYPLGSLHDPGPGYVPLLLAIFIAATGLLIALLGARSRAVVAIEWPEARRATVIIIACAVAAFALERIGYRLTMFALLVFFLGVVERKPVWITALVAAAFSLLSYLLFANLLKVQLPRGPWGY